MADPDPPGWSAGRLLPVGDGHQVWWTEGGDPAGLPVLVIHGGPGGRSRPETAAWWAGLPVRWFCLDQRGCGRSLPRGATAGNTLPALLDDIEALRRHCGLPAWAIAAGSWGAFVAVAYAARHPGAVRGLFLRSAFLGGAGELAHYLAPWAGWLGEAGAAWLGDRRATLAAVYTPGGHALERLGATPGALGLEDRLGLLAGAYDEAQSAPGGVAASGARCPPDPAWTWSEAALADWRVHAHYAQTGWTVGHDAWAWAARALATVSGPVSLVHGRRDAVCPVATSHCLHALRPSATLQLVDEGGHGMGGAAMSTALRAAAVGWVGRLGGQGG